MIKQMRVLPTLLKQKTLRMMSLFVILSALAACESAGIQSVYGCCQLEQSQCNWLRQNQYQYQNNQLIKVPSNNCGTLTKPLWQLLNNHCSGGGIDKGKSEDCINLSQLRNQALVQINYLRSIHGASSILRDPTMDQSAQQWAEQLAQSGQVKNSQIGYGENVWYSEGNYGYTRTLTGAEAINAFYDESRNWDFTNSRPFGTGETGHFTQLVWKSSSQVGVGYAASGDCSKMYAVIYFNPPGNYAGQFTQNVGRGN